MFAIKLKIEYEISIDYLITLDENLKLEANPQALLHMFIEWLCETILLDKTKSHAVFGLQ